MSENQNLNSTKSEIMSWLKIVIIAILIGCLLTLVVKPALVIGDSMSPTLSDRDYLILNRMAYDFSEPKYKDIVVFDSGMPGKPEERILVKRIIGTEGQRVTIRNNEVFINGEKLDESSYIHGAETIGDVDLVVPENNIFVMGDNRMHSLDSRSPAIGLVPMDKVIGKVIFRLIPFKSIKS